MIAHDGAAFEALVLREINKELLERSQPSVTESVPKRADTGALYGNRVVLKN